MDSPDDPVGNSCFVANGFAQRQGGNHWNICDGKDQRPHDAKGNRLCHRAEHFSFDVLESKDRQIHDSDDSDRENDRAQHLAAGLEDAMTHRMPARI